MMLELKKELKEMKKGFKKDIEIQEELWGRVNKGEVKIKTK